MIDKLKIIFILFFLCAGLAADEITYTAKDKISLQGKANHNVKIEVFVNNKKTADSRTNDSGEWTAYDVPLELDTRNEIFAVAVADDGTRSRTSTRLTVVVDTSVPQFSALELQPASAKPDETVKVTAKTDKTNIAQVDAVMPDNTTLKLSGGNGTWTGSWRVPKLISGGTYKVLATAVNKLGTAGQTSAELHINAQAGLSISSPEEGAVIYEDVLNVKGLANNSSHVEVGSERVSVQPDDSFSGYYRFPQPGRNQIKVTAVDHSGGRTEKTVNVIKLITFSDIQNHAVRREIEYLATLGFVQAYPNSSYYAPERNITRAELATLMVRARKIPTYQQSHTSPVFSDVQGNYWALSYIETAARHGLVEGYPGHIYKPANFVTRAEAAAMFARYANVQPIAVYAPVYIDVNERHWAVGFVAALKLAELLPPAWQSQRFYPDQPITRAEVAAILARVRDINKDIELLLGKDPELDSYAANDQAFLPQSSASAPPAEAGAVILANASPREALPGNVLALSAATMQKMQQVSAMLPDQNELPLQYNAATDVWEASWRIPAGFARGEYQVIMKALSENGGLFTTRSNFFTITDGQQIAQSYAPNTAQDFPAIQTSILPSGDGYTYPQYNTSSAPADNVARTTAPVPPPAVVQPSSSGTGKLTRAEAAVILAKYGYLKQAIVNAPPAQDVPLSHPQVKVIKSAIVTGIIPNKKPGHFAPADTVTYQEAAAILRRAKVAGTVNGSGVISAAEFDRLAAKR